MPPSLLLLAFSLLAADQADPAPRLLAGGDVAAIRKRTGLSQNAFARQIGVPVATLRNWETGRRCPVGPARVLLALLDKDPGIVARTLSETA